MSDPDLEAMAADELSRAMTLTWRDLDRIRGEGPGHVRRRVFEAAGAGYPQGYRPTGQLQSGGASWYGPGFYGRTTACGQTFTAGVMGVAHKAGLSRIGFVAEPAK